MAYRNSDEETMCYIARAKCGCILCIALDDGSERDRKSNAKDIADWVRSGLAVERLNLAQAKSDPLYLPYPCPQKENCRKVERDEQKRSKAGKKSPVAAGTSAGEGAKP